MKCLAYALEKWKESGGYLLIRQSRAFRFLFPHFLHMDKTGKITHMTAKQPHGVWWRDLWCIMRGKNYYKKEGDE